MLLAIVAPSVATVFGLLGATCVVVMCFALPALTFERVFDKDEQTLTPARRLALRLTLAVICVIAIISIGDNAYSLARGGA